MYYRNFTLVVLLLLAFAIGQGWAITILIQDFEQVVKESPLIVEAMVKGMEFYIIPNSALGYATITLAVQDVIKGTCPSRLLPNYYCNRDFFIVYSVSTQSEEEPMPFVSKRAKLKLSIADVEKLNCIARSRTESLARIERAKMLLKYHQNETISSIATQLKTNRPKVERCISKALSCGIEVALQDLARKGRTPEIPTEAKTWVVSVACQKPKDLGYAAELWTTCSLAKHIRQHCQQAGYPSLAKLARGTVSKILSKVETKPHKIAYYLERRDPDFDPKMIQVLHVYKEVELLQKRYANGETQQIATLSYDEKPGIQAIANIAPDLSPVPNRHAPVGRDYEYKRLGTVSLLAAIDLFNGHVHGLVRNRHRSQEFIEMLQQVDAFYPKAMKIRIILDNHSAHISKETRNYLATVPNRFEFIFTPTHGSWLNIIETFFSKLTRQCLRGIRVSSKDELVQRLIKYLDEINEMPVVFKWKYKLAEITII